MRRGRSKRTNEYDLVESRPLLMYEMRREDNEDDRKRKKMDLSHVTISCFIVFALIGLVSFAFWNVTNDRVNPRSSSSSPGSDVLSPALDVRMKEKRPVTRARELIEQFDENDPASVDRLLKHVMYDMEHPQEFFTHSESFLDNIAEYVQLKKFQDDRANFGRYIHYYGEKRKADDD